MNKILKCFKNDGTETVLDQCDYFQLELIGNHAKAVNAIILISKKCVDLVLMYKWYLAKNGYPFTHDNISELKLGKRRGAGLKIHRILYAKYIGEIPSKYVVDHINRDRLDNRLENLRVCSQRENSYNTSKRNNKYKGVKEMKNSWSASITKDGQRHTIKDIPSEKEAARIYDLMAEELFGEYAGKNYNYDL